MRKYRDVRNNFSAGVIAKEYLARARDEVTGTALKTGLNAFVTDAGTVMRRCGSNRMFRTPNAGRTLDFEMSDGTLRHLVFHSANVHIYRSDGTLDATLAGPWGSSENTYGLALAIDKDRIIVVSDAFAPRVITMKPGAFSIGLYTFRTEPNGRRASIFGGAGVFGLETVTLNPSGYTGVITVQFSEDVLTPQHVGVHFMYMQCQLRIETVVNGQNGTATVLDRLYPTLRVGVENASAYRIGDLVQGDVTNTEALIVAVDASTIDVVLRYGYSYPMAPNGDAPGEKLISPTAGERVTSVTPLADPAPVNTWYEELVSAARGYPSAACMHRERLVLGGFPAATGMIAASAQGEIEDFDLGAGSPDDAIQEFIGEDPNAIIRHLVSTEQLVILTDRGTWFTPESGQASFTPEGIGFDPISPDVASEVPPVWTPEGVVFLDEQDRPLLLSVTGTQRGPYSVVDLGRLGGHLIKSPKQMVYSSGIGGRQERVIAVLNGDGTAAMFTYRRGSDQAGWTPWARGGGGIYYSFSSFASRLFCLSEQSGLRHYEEFDFDAVIDSEFSPASTAYVSETVHLLKNKHVVGTAALNSSGVLGSIGTLAPVDRLGRDFPVEIETTPMVIGEAGRQRRRNTKTWADVIDTGLFYLNGKQCAAYPYDGDLETQPQVGDFEYRAGQLGSSVGRTVKLEQVQGEGAPLHLRSLTIEVSAR